MSRAEITHNMNELTKQLQDILTAIKAENSNGAQFDYVTNPRLADVTDKLHNTVYEIEKLVYQKHR